MKAESIFWLWVAIISAGLAVVYISSAVKRICQHIREIKVLRRALAETTDEEESS